MPIPVRDRNVIAALRRAETRTQAWRGLMPEAKAVFARVIAAAGALESAVEAVDAERADDDPARAARDEAGVRLRDTATQVVGHVRRRAHLDNTDALGNVKDAGKIATVEAFLDEYTPKGGLSALGEGQTLATHARALQAGLYRHGYPAQADALGPLLEAFDGAFRRVETETVELSAAYRRLEEARTEAETARVAARAYTVFAAVWSPGLGIDVTAAFPVTRSNPASDEMVDAAPAETAPAAPGENVAPTTPLVGSSGNGADGGAPST